MAISFVVSYTFSPSTTISSSQVNTNTNDVAAVFQGLEGRTKSFAALQVDATPSFAADVARKDYVDHYSAYRRPVLQYGSATTVAVESGLDGTSGDIPIVFPDGQLRTETSTTRTTFNITRNAVLVTSGAQSGLTGATSEANDTWYALYAVKVTDSSTLWVTVGSTVLPLRANFATLNTAYQTNGWIYLGLIRNGSVSTQSTDIVPFVMAGNFTWFYNANTAANLNGFEYDVAGLRFADQSASATSLTYSATRGTTSTDIPNNIAFTHFHGGTETSTGNIFYLFTSAGTTGRLLSKDLADHSGADANGWVRADDGAAVVSSSGNIAASIMLDGFVDGVLGIGSNPLL